MKEVKQLLSKVYDELDEIRNKKEKTLNDLSRYEKLQQKARQINNVIVWLEEVK